MDEEESANTETSKLITVARPRLTVLGSGFAEGGGEDVGKAADEEESANTETPKRNGADVVKDGEDEDEDKAEGDDETDGEDVDKAAEEEEEEEDALKGVADAATLRSGSVDGLAEDDSLGLIFD
jgi:hypothetical protein